VPRQPVAGVVDGRQLLLLHADVAVALLPRRALQLLSAELRKKGKFRASTWVCTIPKIGELLGYIQDTYVGMYTSESCGK
jgi:hypothetical protein